MANFVNPPLQAFAGSTNRLVLTIKDYDGATKLDPTSITLTTTNNMGQKIGTDIIVPIQTTKKSVGVYVYDYKIPDNATREITITVTALYNADKIIQIQKFIIIRR